MFRYTAPLLFLTSVFAGGADDPIEDDSPKQQSRRASLPVVNKPADKPLAGEKGVVNIKLKYTPPREQKKRRKKSKK